jgi:hypothetical protein
MHSWPFSLKENGSAINPPLHSNREIALASSQVPDLSPPIGKSFASASYVGIFLYLYNK